MSTSREHHDGTVGDSGIIMFREHQTKALRLSLVLMDPDVSAVVSLAHGRLRGGKLHFDQAELALDDAAMLRVTLDEPVLFAGDAVTVVLARL
jgi:hypothetical protein